MVFSFDSISFLLFLFLSFSSDQFDHVTPNGKPFIHEIFTYLGVVWASVFLASGTHAELECVKL